MAPWGNHWLLCVWHHPFRLTLIGYDLLRESKYMCPKLSRHAVMHDMLFKMTEIAEGATECCMVKDCTNAFPSQLQSTVNLFPSYSIR